MLELISCDAVRRIIRQKRVEPAPTPDRSALLRWWRQLAPIGAIGILVLGESGCCSVVPKGAVVFFPDKLPTDLEGRTEPVPREWRGRLVAVGTGNPELTGAREHRHSIAHKHQDMSAPTTTPVAPVGVAQTTAGAEHTHAVESFTTGPALSEPSPNLPSSYGVRSAIVRYRVGSVPEGMIIAFLGDTVPKGYRECDGRDGTPNLAGRFLLVTDTPGPAGSSSHSHGAQHSHTWGGAESGSSPAYVHDEVSTPGPDAIRTTQPKHVHVVSERAPMTGSSTGEAAHDPPSVAVRFVQATADAKALPRRALLPFVAGLVPTGWSEVRVIGGHDVVGRFLRGTTATLPPGALSGSASHDHAFESAHGLRLLPPSGEGPVDRSANAPPVAKVDHEHAAIPKGQFQTGPATNSPPVVRLRFIVKNGD